MLTTAYTKNLTDPRPGACTHVFQTRGTRSLTATVTWSATWVGSNGEAGNLPDLTSTTTFPLTITAFEAVTD